jgi:hypothetical protein
MPLESEKLVYAIAKKHYAHKRLKKNEIYSLANLTQINKELIVLSHKTSHDLKSPINKHARF